MTFFFIKYVHIVSILIRNLIHFICHLPRYLHRGPMMPPLTSKQPATTSRTSTSAWQAVTSTLRTWSVNRTTSSARTSSERWRSDGRVARQCRDETGWTGFTELTQNRIHNAVNLFQPASSIHPSVLFARCLHTSPVSLFRFIQFSTQTHKHSIAHIPLQSLHYKVGSHQHAILDPHTSSAHCLCKISCWSETRVFLFSEYRLWLKPVHVNDSSNMEGDWKGFFKYPQLSSDC